MRDYQRKKTKYILPAAVYHRTLWTIRDYHRIKDELCLMVVVGGNKGEGPSSGATGDPTFNIAVKHGDYIDIINAIDNAKEVIPPEYINGIWNNILYSARYPKDSERSTYGHMKSRFIYEVAKNLHYI